MALEALQLMEQHRSSQKTLWVLCWAWVPAAPKGHHLSPSPGQCQLPVSSQSPGRATSSEQIHWRGSHPARSPLPVHIPAPWQPQPHAGSRICKLLTRTSCVGEGGKLCRGAEPSSSRFHSQIYWCCEENETMWSRWARSSWSRRKFPER